jgi:hypothetical protein
MTKVGLTYEVFQDEQKDGDRANESMNKEQGARNKEQGTIFASWS